MVQHNHDEASFDALVFDLDGALLHAVEAAERVWAAWAFGHGMDVATFLPSIYGTRMLDSIRQLSRPAADHSAVASRVRSELDDIGRMEPVAGAGAFLASLPQGRWAAVTGAPRHLALERLRAAGLPQPGVLVSADDTGTEMSSPAGFELAAGRLGFDIRRCMVISGSHAGTAAARLSGARLVTVRASASDGHGGLFQCIDDYRSLRVATAAQGRMRLACIHSGELRY